MLEVGVDHQTVPLHSEPKHAIDGDLDHDTRQGAPGEYVGVGLTAEVPLTPSRCS
jgi:hypothetical protein